MSANDDPNQYEGFDIPQDTTLANLWHVGDPTRDYREVSTHPSAYAAREAVEKVIPALDASSA